jgi:hypothetical protein
MFSKVSLLLLLIASVLLFGCNQEPQKMVRLKIVPGAQLEQGWQPEYLNDLGCMFGLPAGWDLTRETFGSGGSGGGIGTQAFLKSNKQLFGRDDKKETGGFMAMSFGASSSGGLTIGMLVGRKLEAKRYESPQQAASEFVNEARDEMGWTKFEVGDIELPVGPAVRVKAETEEHGMIFTINFYVLVDGKSQYVFMFVGATQSNEEKVPTLKIMKTFRVFPPEVQPQQPGPNAPGVTAQPGAR